MPFKSTRYAVTWQGNRYPFDEIKEGDIFRLYEADGKALNGDERLYIATCDAWLNPMGVMQIEVELYVD